MQITTTTGRTVEIYANNAELVSYRAVRNGKAFGPVRFVYAAPKAGSVGAEIRAALAPADPFEAVREAARVEGRKLGLTDAQIERFIAAQSA